VEVPVEKIWQAQYVRGVPTHIDFEDITLPEALDRTVSKYPQNPALMFEGTTVSYHELAESVARFAAVLRAIGVKPGQRVSLLLPNIVQTPIAIYGALRAGAIVVMHNPRLDDMLLEYQLRDAGSEILIALDVLVPRMMNIRRRTKVKRILSCHIRDYLPYVKKKLFPLVRKELHLETPRDDAVLDFKELLDSREPSTRAHDATMNDTAFILYTSATTGKSKGVELTHANMSKNVQQVRAWFPTFRDGQEIVVACLPFFHVFGLTCALNIGIYYGYANALVPLPTAKSILEAVHNYKVTFLPALPVFYTSIINSPNLKKYNLRSLQGCFSGAAPLPLEIIRSFESLTGAKICEGYGLTECSPTSHINPLGGKTKVGTIGLPLPDTDAKIVDVDNPDVEITSPNVPGELCIRGPQVMKGYVNLPDQTAATLKGGWLFTGDIATVDEEGYFSIVDRKKDLIPSGSTKVYPRDVDEVLFRNPAIVDACTLGVPAQTGGEMVKSYVVVKKGQKLTPADIIDHCTQHLSAEQVPKEVEFIEELPRNAAGKVLRKELRRMHLVRMSTAKPKENKPY